ncbi:hypothetical protein PR048_006786 [Dryococelus australis]|uniref:Uncharacterized protein n=1 Tax=Dryococelus australis TaxID=614101 RepID=A0ABQ9IBY7_9NEOP|nr:hypothetical protein PR048_006786 [Dryococelus australis]
MHNNVTNILMERVAFAEPLDSLPPTKVNGVESPGRSLTDFRKWESCRTMPLVGRFSRDLPFSPALAFQPCSILASFLPHQLSRPRCKFPGRRIDWQKRPAVVWDDCWSKIEEKVYGWEFYVTLFRRGRRRDTSRATGRRRRFSEEMRPLRQYKLWNDAAIVCITRSNSQACTVEIKQFEASEQQTTRCRSNSIESHTPRSSSAPTQNFSRGLRTGEQAGHVIIRPPPIHCSPNRRFAYSRMSREKMRSCIDMLKPQPNIRGNVSVELRQHVLAEKQFNAGTRRVVARSQRDRSTSYLVYEPDQPEEYLTVTYTQAERLAEDYLKTAMLLAIVAGPCLEANGKTKGEKKKKIEWGANPGRGNTHRVTGFPAGTRRCPSYPDMTRNESLGWSGAGMHWRGSPWWEASALATAPPLPP